MRERKAAAQGQRMMKSRDAMNIEEKVACLLCRVVPLCSGVYQELLNCKLVVYADDILLYRPISSNEDYRALQADMVALNDWTTLNAMTFNTAKCNSMTVSRKKNHFTPLSPLSLNGSVLETVTTFKYLRVLISSDLSWSHHIQGVCSKA